MMLVKKNGKKGREQKLVLCDESFAYLGFNWFIMQMSFEVEDG